MKQTIQLRIGQHLTMTPQLQQAIRLLQLSAIDLQQEIQQALDSNIMLETEDEASISSLPDELDASDKNLALDEEQSAEEVATEQDLDLTHAELPEEWPIDSDWSDIYDSYTPNNSKQNEYDSDALDQKTRTETLRDYLLWQLNLIVLSDRDRIIALAIIDAISENGYLTSSLEEIMGGLGVPNLELDEMVDVLQRLQDFDPPGIAARNLQECLLLQLKQSSEHSQIQIYTLNICANYFHLLDGQHNTDLMNLVSITEDDLRAVVKLLRTLQPYPGMQIVQLSPQYIIPDIIVNRCNGTWRVEVNAEITPRLRVNHDYAKLIRRADHNVDNVCLKTHLQEARWFIKNLVNRNETLLRVATKIVELQRGFFEYGHEAMRPLVLRDVADALAMHESTVSRVTNQKYLQCPRGTFELKFFFPSHVSTEDGGQCSAIAIYARIKKLIATECPESPHSDEAIAKLLAKQGIQVARRTVAKYRESMGIQASKARKRLP